MKETQRIIKTLTEEYGLTLEQVAAKMKANYNTVYTWAHGIRNANHWAIEKLNRILHGYESRRKKEGAYNDK